MGTVFLLALKWSAPGYIEQVWNLPALSGVLVYGLPLEELLFGFSFGLMRTGIYEHITWRGSAAPKGAHHSRLIKIHQPEHRNAN